jgi:deoxyribonuclease V
VIVCLDVDYRDAETVTACVGMSDWSAPAAAFERTRRVLEAPQPYEPGRFYLREMPHLLAMLEEVVGVHGPITRVVVDGYVWLATGRPGLGAHLHAAMAAGAGAVPVVGVAKTAFRDNDRAIAVLRGQSGRPLYVTAIGCDEAEAARDVASMHGAHRLPTLLARVDRLARGDV